jgi:2-methylcitrate dehydratase PrpD
MPTATDTLAAFATGLDLARVPPSLVASMRLHVIDSIGCGLAGAETTLSRQARAFVALENGAGSCAILGTSDCAPPAAAAFANAIAMNALDFDDGFEVEGRGMGHPGATIVAAALSGCAGRPVSGNRFLAAVTAAYEINARVILSIEPSIERFREVYGVCQHQSVAAAVVCGLLAGLDADGLENAIGLAGTLANVPSLRAYNWDRRPLVSFKDFNGPAAEAGVRAVSLHGVGMIGARDVLGERAGLWRMLGSDRFDGAALLDGLGDTWRAEGASFKPYPTCRWMHTTLEAFEAVCATEAWAAADCEDVAIHAAIGMARDFMDPAPTTMVDAQFSLPFALAALAVGPRQMARWYDPATLEDAALRAFASRVRAVIDPEIDALMTGTRRPAGQVTVTAAGRSVTSARIEYPLGCAERTLPAHAIEAKFLANAGPVLGQQAAQALLQRLLRLEDEPDVSALIGRMAPHSRKPRQLSL